MHCGGHVSVITCGRAAAAATAETTAAALQESAEWRRGGGGAGACRGLDRHGGRRVVRLQHGRKWRRLLLCLRLLLDRRETGGGRNGRCCWLLRARGRKSRRCCSKWLGFTLRSGVVRCCGHGRGVIVVRRLECPCFRGGGCVCDGGGRRGLGRGGAQLQRGLSGLGLLLLLLPRRL